MARLISLLPVLAITLAGCAADTTKIQPEYVSPTKYSSYSCTQIAAERERVARKAEDVGAVVDKMAADDEGQMAVGLIIFFPALFFLEGEDTPQTREYARLTGEIEALERESANKGCSGGIRQTAQDTGGDQTSSAIQALKTLYTNGLLTEEEYLEKCKPLIDQQIQEEMKTLKLAKTKPASAAEITQSIRVGTRTTYRCTGPSGRVYRYKVTRLEDGVIHFDKTKDGKPGILVQPLWATGTNLFHENNYSDGKGDREQDFDVSDFRGLGEYKTGETFGGIVRESHTKSSWKWRYSIEVGERSRVNHELLGDVEVIEIHENRKVVGRAYTSKTTSKIAPSIAGLSLGWVYEDEKGVRNCRLTNIEL